MKILSLFGAVTFSFILSLVSFHAQAQSDVKVYRVADEESFIKALHSNSRIYIAKNTDIMLSDILEKEGDGRIFAMSPLRAGEYLTLDSSPGIFRSEVFDGIELILNGLENITIEGEGESRSRILVSPRYANVLNFKDCANIKLVNLEIGHTEEGYCEGGVLNLISCDNIEVKNCELFGCGTIGVLAENSRNFRCISSVICHCTYGIICLLPGNKNFLFQDCHMHHNEEFDLIELREGNKGIVFDRCRIEQNRGTLFGLRSILTLKDCYINHEGEVGNIDLIKRIRGRFVFRPGQDMEEE